MALQPGYSCTQYPQLTSSWGAGLVSAMLRISAISCEGGFGDKKGI